MSVLTLWRQKETLNWYLICDVQRACYTDLSFEFTTFEFAGVKFFCSCLVLGAFIFFELFHCLFFFFLNYIFNTRWIKNFFGGNFLATLNNNVLSNNVSYSYLHYSWFLLLVFVLSHFFSLRCIGEFFLRLLFQNEIKIEGAERSMEKKLPVLCSWCIRLRNINASRKHQSSARWKEIRVPLNTFPVSCRFSILSLSHSPADRMSDKRDI